MADWLENTLAVVRRRLVARAAGEGLLLALAALCAAALHLAWGGGAWMVLLAWAVLLYLLVWSLARCLEAAGPDLEIARRLERFFPSLDTSVLNAVSFAPGLPTTADAAAGPPRPGQEGAATAPLHEHLASREIGRAQGLLEGVEPRRALSWERARRIALGLLVLATLNAATALWRTGPYLDALARLATPLEEAGALLARLKEKAAERAVRDILADLSVEVQYPAYTGLPPQRVTGGDGTVSAMRGAVVRLSARSLEPVDEAVLEVFAGEDAEGGGDPATSLQVQVSGGRVLAAQFTAAEPGSYRFLLDGEPSRGYPIQISEDAYPQVSMPQPATDQEVTPDERVEVTWEASDDFGLSKVEVVAKVDGQRERRWPLSVEGADATVQAGQYGLDLSVFELGEGDQSIDLYVEATDNDTVSGPKVSRSGSILLTLRSAERIHGQLMEDQERLLYGMVDWLADALERFPLEGAVSGKDLARDFAALDVSAQRVTEAFPEILARMREDELADYNVYIALQNMARELGGLRSRLVGWAKGQALSHKSFSGPASAVAPGLSQQAAAHEQPLEKDIDYLDRLLFKQRMDDALRGEEDLREAAQRLQELIDEYKRTQDPELKKKILQEMAALKEKMAEALSRLSRMYAELPDEFINPKVQEQLDDQDFGDLSQKLARAMESGDLDAALPDFEAFLRQVEQMLGGMQESAGQFAGEEFFKDLAAVQEAEAEAAKLEHEQEKLLKRTQEVQEQVLSPEAQQRSQELMKEVREQLDQAQAAAQEAQRHEQERIALRRRDLSDPAASLSPQERSKRTQEMRALERMRLPGLLDSLQRQVAQVGEDLDRLDTEAAQAGLLRDLSRLEQIEKQAQASRQRTPPGLKPRDPDSGKALAETKESLRQAFEKLDQAQKARQPRLSQAARNELGQIAGQQRALAQRTQDLAKKLGELAERSPMVQPAPGQNAQQAAGQMGEATQRLGQGQPSGAVPSEASAKAKLSQVREQLGQTRERFEQAMQGGGVPLPGWMRGLAGRGREGVNGQVNPRARVELPAAGAYRVPPEFRDEILKSMKEPGPAEYEPLNDEYYRKLIR